MANTDRCLSCQEEFIVTHMVLYNEGRWWRSEEVEAAFCPFCGHVLCPEEEDEGC